MTRNPDTPLDVINREIVICQACPRLARYIREIAVIRRRAYRDQEYWGKPVPSFGDLKARLLIVGLAPGAHGANRTGRPFTGDRSGEYLYRALYKAGFANQQDSRAVGDGLELHDAWITAAVHCAPPDNKPATDEIERCSRFLDREFNEMPQLAVVVVLGKIAFDAWRSILRKHGQATRGWKFGHNVVYPGKPALVCSYHPSQQNTSTGRLTDAMLDDVFASAAKIIRSGSDRPERRR